MSTMLISLVVVGACFAVVLWFTIGSVGQPATKDVKPAYGDGPRPASRVIAVEAGVPVVDGGAEDEDVTGAENDPDNDDHDIDDHDIDDHHDHDIDDHEIENEHDAETEVRPEQDDPAAPEPAMVAGRAATVTRAAAVATRPAVDEPAVGSPVTAAPAKPRPSRIRRPRRVVNLPGSYSFSPLPPVTAGRRLRSALGVLVVVTVVGLGLAAAVGVLVVAISRALESAVS